MTFSRILGIWEGSEFYLYEITPKSKFYRLISVTCEWERSFFWVLILLYSCGAYLVGPLSWSQVVSSESFADSVSPLPSLTGRVSPLQPSVSTSDNTPSHSLSCSHQVKRGVVWWHWGRYPSRRLVCLGLRSYPLLDVWDVPVMWLSLKYDPVSVGDSGFVDVVPWWPSRVGSTLT